jgi:hypothetical protein
MAPAGFPPSRPAENTSPREKAENENPRPPVGNFEQLPVYRHHTTPPETTTRPPCAREASCARAASHDSTVSRVAGSQAARWRPHWSALAPPRRRTQKTRHRSLILLKEACCLRQAHGNQAALRGVDIPHHRHRLIQTHRT